MKEFVGVKSFDDIFVLNSFKQEALIFKRILIPDFKETFFDRFLPMCAELRRPGDPLDEIAWLFENGIIEDVRPTGLDDFKKLMNSHDDYAHSVLGTAYANDSKVARQYYNRSLCIELRELERVDAYPIIYQEFLPFCKYDADNSDVVQVVLNALPVPDHSVSWEQIIEYRSDPASHGKFLALRNWMNDIARAKLNPREIEDKLEWLIYDYQQHLKLHKLKANAGTIETVIVTGAELLENLVKFNWSKAAKLLFSLKSRQIALMEGELSSPGREIAYMLDARERLSNQNNSDTASA